MRSRPPPCLQPGVDHAVTSTAATAAEKELFVIAAQMKNFVYLVGDRRTGDAVVIDGVGRIRPRPY